MKRLLSMSVIALTLSVTHVTAQTAVSGSNSSSTATTTTDTRSASSSGVIQNYYSSGTTRIESAPPVSAPSVFGGGHPCLAGKSGGLSVIGGGLSYGQGTPEPACMAWVMGNPEIAVSIMMENSQFRKAACKNGFYRVGNTKYPISCAEQLPARQRVVAASSKPPLEVRCERNGNKVTPVVSRKVRDAYTTAEIQGVCK